MNSEAELLLARTPLSQENAEQLAALFMSFLTPETITTVDLRRLQFLQQVYTQWNSSPDVVATFPQLLRARLLFTAALAIHTDASPSFSDHLYQMAEFVQREGGVAEVVAARSGVSVLLAVYLHVHGLPPERQPPRCDTALSNLLGLVRGHVIHLAELDAAQAADAVETLVEVGTRPSVLLRDVDRLDQAQLAALVAGTDTEAIAPTELELEEAELVLPANTDLLLLCAQCLSLLPASAASQIAAPALRSLLDLACSPSLVIPGLDPRAALIARLLLGRAACGLAAVFPRDAAQAALMHVIERLQAVVRRDAGDALELPDGLSCDVSRLTAEATLYRVIRVLRTRPARSIYSSVARLLLAGESHSFLTIYGMVKREGEAVLSTTIRPSMVELTLRDVQSALHLEYPEVLKLLSILGSKYEDPSVSSGLFPPFDLLASRSLRGWCHGENQLRSVSGTRHNEALLAIALAATAASRESQRVLVVSTDYYDALCLASFWASPSQYHSAIEPPFPARLFNFFDPAREGTPADHKIVLAHPSDLPGLDKSAFGALLVTEACALPLSCTDERQLAGLLEGLPEHVRVLAFTTESTCQIMEPLTPELCLAHELLLAHCPDLVMSTAKGANSPLPLPAPAVLAPAEPDLVAAFGAALREHRRELNYAFAGNALTAAALAQCGRDQGLAVVVFDADTGFAQPLPEHAPAEPLLVVVRDSGALLPPLLPHYRYTELAMLSVGEVSPERLRQRQLAVTATGARYVGEEESVRPHDNHVPFVPLRAPMLGRLAYMTVLFRSVISNPTVQVLRRSLFLSLPLPLLRDPTPPPPSAEAPRRRRVVVPSHAPAEPRQSQRQRTRRVVEIEPATPQPASPVERRTDPPEIDDALSTITFDVPLVELARRRQLEGTVNPALQQEFERDEDWAVESSSEEAAPVTLHTTPARGARAAPRRRGPIFDRGSAQPPR